MDKHQDREGSTSSNKEDIENESSNASTHPSPSSHNNSPSPSDRNTPNDSDNASLVDYMVGSIKITLIQPTTNVNQVAIT